MAQVPPKKDSKIVIVGAGVFGLSTTLHLLQRGYTNIHIFDRQPFNINQYDETQGADGASCDLNKIVRASYGGEQLYQNLAFKAMPEWERWNRELAATPRSELPKSLDPNISLWHNSGFLRLSKNGLEAKEIETQQNFPSSIKHTQYRISDSKRRTEATKSGIPASKLDPFNRLQRNLSVDGILDTTAGYVLASRACAWALHLVQKSGHVTTHFGPNNALQSLMKTKNRITGIVTTGIERHTADFVLVACGGWTPSLVPETEEILETTAGSVLSIKIPKERKDLWSKFDESVFPVWSWGMGSYSHQNSTSENIGGLYGLPLTPEGILKIAFRGAKWTSYTRRSSVGKELSYPKTEVDKIPLEAMRVLRSFVQENLPELLDLDLSNLRLCWYTDSVDNSFLIDYVPGVEGLVVASGGSGHGFKFLPVLGEHVVDVIEGKETEYTRLFKWKENGRK
ncbi:L-pipecolate oxidase [Pseudocercospora fuligena]|uniref:L-pipecolate oxidase n=1 Tax=Pseudocercospora fuligena TaxID=685502 RepID=A0A8H6RMR0_9PEZI|nr:L-pipecolate oxidase [Pseudocercospora fuligena]